MRVLHITNLLMICAGIGGVFRISGFLDPFFNQDYRISFFKPDHDEQERQSTEVSNQFLPLFGITFVFTLIMNLLLNPTGKRFTRKVRVSIYYSFHLLDSDSTTCTITHGNTCSAADLQNVINQLSNNLNNLKAAKDAIEAVIGGGGRRRQLVSTDKTCITFIDLVKRCKIHLPIMAIDNQF